METTITRNKRALAYVLILTIWLSNSSCEIFRDSPKRSDKDSFEKIIYVARSYKGVPYLSGGNDYKGIDCSGLLCCVFKEIGMKIPRTSWQQADYFPPVEEQKIQKGDLVFFATSSGHNINHAGIVTEIRGKNEVFFISASTSRGVVEDNLFSNYWRTKLTKIARPILKI